MVTVELLQAVIASTNDGVIIAEYNGNNNPILFVNTAFEQISGYSADELMGQDCRVLKGSDNDQEALGTLKQAIESGEECDVKLRNYTKDGHLFWNQLKISYLKVGEKITHIISINKDITQEEYSRNVLDKVNVLYREMSKRLEYTNETDELTKLKNRGHLSTRGEFILGAAKREKLRMHAIIIDVDNFKVLNTIGGKPLGDDCLIQVANIVGCYFCRATDIAIRMCDDEFVVICIEDDDRRVLDRAEQLHKEAQSARIKDTNGKLHKISVSIGIYSVTPNKYTTLEEMIKHAGQLVFQGAHGVQNHIAHNIANKAARPTQH